MMQRTVTFLLCLIMVMMVSQICIAAAPPNSCVVCHTNESLMKSMHQPPELPASAGEG